MGTVFDAFETVPFPLPPSLSLCGQRCYMDTLECQVFIRSLGNNEFVVSMKDVDKTNAYCSAGTFTKNWSSNYRNLVGRRTDAQRLGDTEWKQTTYRKAYEC